MQMQYSVNDMTQNLIDAGCDNASAQAFISHLQEGKTAKAKDLLQSHRHNLLKELHTAQKKIDCLDYLLFMLQKTKL